MTLKTVTAYCLLIGMLFSAFVVTSGCDVNKNQNQPTNSSGQSGSARETEITQLDETEYGLRILFLGNSHTWRNDIPGLVKQILESNDPETNVKVQSEKGTFLSSFVNNQKILDQIKNGNWDFVVLQGQKISSSGKYTYPTDAAESLSELIRQSGSTVVWYSEWGLQDRPEHYLEIEMVYQGLQQVGDLFAPVGRVWSEMFARDPNLVLHDPDGNHSNIHGANLAALTLSTMIAKTDCRSFPGIQQSELSSEEWKTFTETTWVVVENYLE